MSGSGAGWEALGSLLSELQQPKDGVDPQKIKRKLQAIRIVVETADLPIDSDLEQLVGGEWPEAELDELAAKLEAASEISLQQDLELDGLALWSAVDRLERELKIKITDVDAENWYTIGDVFACI